VTDDQAMKVGVTGHPHARAALPAARDSSYVVSFQQAALGK